MRTVDEWSDIAEAAFTELQEARRIHTEAKADYEFMRLNAKALSNADSQAARDAEAEVAARAEKVALIRAQGALDLAKTAAEHAQDQMVKAMSDRKWTGRQDGGGDF